MNPSVTPSSSANLLVQIESLKGQQMQIHEVDGNMNIVPLTFLERLWHYRDTAFRTDQDQRIAAILMKELEPLKGKRPAEVGEDSNVRLASDYFRAFKDSSDPLLSRYRQELLALKLGISHETLTKNPEFEKFATDNHLDRYLWKFDHTLAVDQDQISLPVAGIEKPWKDFLNSPAVVKGKAIGNYLQTGFEVEERSSWRELKPFIKGKPDTTPEWGKRYIFELCSWYSKEDGPRIAGDHTWFRLKTPEGDLYSVGIYMPTKHNPSFWEKVFPMSILKCELASPDKSECWPGQSFDTLPIEITEEQFKAMKGQIEKDHVEGLPFQLLSHNCTQYAGKIAKIAHIHLPTEDPWPVYIFPRFVTRPFGFIHSILPRFLQVIAEVITAVFLNTLAIILGGWRVDPQVTNAKSQSPLIATFWDFFDIAKINIHHPFVLATSVRETILDWRKAEAEADLLNQDKFKYALPPQFIIAT